MSLYRFILHLIKQKKQLIKLLLLLFVPPPVSASSTLIIQIALNIICLYLWIYPVRSNGRELSSLLYCQKLIQSTPALLIINGNVSRKVIIECSIEIARPFWMNYNHQKRFLLLTGWIRVLIKQFQSVTNLKEKDFTYLFFLV